MLVISRQSIKVIFIRELEAPSITNKEGEDNIYNEIFKLGADHVIFRSYRKLYCVQIPQSSVQPITYSVISSIYPDGNVGSGPLKISDNEIMLVDENNKIKIIALAQG